MRNKYNLSCIIVSRVGGRKGPYSEYGLAKVPVPSFYHLGSCEVDGDHYRNLLLVLLLWKVLDDYAASDAIALIITDVKCLSGAGLRTSYAG